MTLSIEDLNKIKQAPAHHGVLPVFHTRWSPRSFTDRDVSPADMSRIFEAARWAASSYNEQPWRFLVGHKGSEAYKKIFDSVIPFNQAWAASAPVLMLGVAKTKFSHNDSANRVALYDLGAAASYLTLEAANLGLSTHQMAGFDPDAARKAFSIPEDYIFGAVIALGYQGALEALPNEQFRAQEAAPRTRKPFAEFVFSSWDTPAEIG
jgi:nitroreductase